MIWVAFVLHIEAASDVIWVALYCTQAASGVIWVAFVLYREAATEVMWVAFVLYREAASGVIWMAFVYNVKGGSYSEVISVPFVLYTGS